MQPGDVVYTKKTTFYRSPNCKRDHQGDAKPNPNNALVWVFLGACERKGDPDILKRLNALGWLPAATYECSIEIDIEDDTDVATHMSPRQFHDVYTASTPTKAVEGAVRLARSMVKQIDGILSFVKVWPRKLGGISEDGRSFPGRMAPLLVWSTDSAATLDAEVDALKFKLRQAQS